MLFDRKCPWMLAGALTVLPAAAGAGSLGAVSARPAQAEAAGQFRAAPTLTGKERLGGKASDDQRMDNCKVAPEKRGPKQRPDSCEHEKISLFLKR